MPGAVLLFSICPALRVMYLKMRLNGFTIPEVLLILVILGILSAIAIPTYKNYIVSSKRTEARTNLQSLRLLLEEYNAEYGRYCPDSTCSANPYDYIEANNGTATTDEITSFLSAFSPKAAASNNAVIYNYSINVTGANLTNYTVTANPVTARGTPSGNLTIDQDGSKSGW